MNASLDPDLLFISVDRWNDSIKKDEFLQHLIDNLLYIDEYLHLKINWSDELEACLWEAPIKQPWLQSEHFRNQIIPLVYKRLQANRIFKDTNNVDICRVNPEMVFDFEESIFHSFLQIMHVIISESSNSYLCLGLQNHKNSKYFYTFSCNCCPSSIRPILINKPEDWLDYLDINYYWPVNDNDTYKMVKAINVFYLKEYGEIKLSNEFEISRGFLNDLIATNSNRKGIIKSIVKRLRLTQSQAGFDGGLKDEFIAQSNQYRFRVSGDARIHYNYSPDNNLIFLRYYPSGHHDKGI